MWCTSMLESKRVSLDIVKRSASSNAPMMPNMLVHHINYTAFLKMRDVLRDIIYPRFTDAEAKDLYTRTITLMYDQLYPYLWIATRPLYRVTDMITISITEHRYLDDAVYIKAEVDYLPF